MQKTSSPDFGKRAVSDDAGCRDRAPETAHARLISIDPHPNTFRSWPTKGPREGPPRAYPEIDLSLELDDSFVDAVTGGFDAVLRYGAIGDGRLIARRLASSWCLLIASPGYLKENGTPVSLADLERHRGILYSNRASDWRFATGALTEIDIGQQAEGAELFLSYPKDHGASAKIRAFGESLRRNFGDPPYWERLPDIRSQR